MRYLILFLLFVIPVKAQFLEDVILTPFSWTDNEIKQYINKERVTVNAIIATNGWTTGRNQHLIEEKHITKIIQKDKKGRKRDAILMDFNIISVGDLR